MLTIDSAERQACLTLPDRADVSSALALHETLLRATLDSIDSIELDASAVNKTDVAALQLLVAWLRVLDATGGESLRAGLGRGYPVAAAFAPDGRLLATST